MNLSPVLDHLWQSTLFAAVAGLLTLALRRNRARVRHAVWLAASAKFLVPLSLLIALGSHIQWHKPAPPNFTVVVDAVTAPFTAPMAAIPIPPAKPANPLPFVVLGIWACGIAGISWSWWVRWRRIAAAVRAGSPVDLALPIPARTSPTLVEPGIFGIFRPVLLLPAGIFERLTPPQVEAVIAHELYHVRHRDNLVAAFQMFVETVFWFHPLAWWIGKRMVEERERACDEGVLIAGSEPRVYAEAVLNVCKLYVESPLVCVSGITGANLKKRIEAIMTKRIANNLPFAKKLGLAVAATATLALPIAIGMLHSAIPALAMPFVPPAPPPAPMPAAAPPAQVVPPPVAMAPQVVVQSNPTDDEVRKTRMAYAGINFDNPAMRRTYIAYGPPDRILQGSAGVNSTTIWDYNYLEDFHSNVEFAFRNNLPMVHINYPPPAATFTGDPDADAASVAPLAQALVHEMAGRGGTPASAATTPGLPGRHATIEVYTSKQPVNLTVPLDTLSGRIDLIGSVVEAVQPGVKGSTVANFRDYVNIAVTPPAGLYQAAFTLAPGSYVCRLLVREDTTGLIYTEAIPFQLK